MSAPEAPGSLPHRIRQDPYATPETAPPAPTFTPHPAPPVLQMPAFPPAGFATGPQALQRAWDAMRAQGWTGPPAAPIRRAGPAEHLPIFDAVRAGTGPQTVITAPTPPPAPEPAPQPVPEPVPEPAPDSTWLPPFLQQMLADAAEGAARRIFSGSCPACQGRTAGWCQECQDALARAAMYARLSPLVYLARTDRGAVAAILAREWREDTDSSRDDTWTRTEERAL